MAALGNRGTVTEASGFNPEEDAQKLYNAMKGNGTNEATIIEILAHRTIAQRQKIKESFKQSVGKELVDCLKSELSGNFEQVVVGLMMPAPVYDAYELRNAIKGAGTEEACLIDILASRTNAEVKEIIATYKKEYGKSLDEDVSGDTSGMFQRVLVSLLTAGRDQSTKVDEAQAVQDAKDIYEAGEARWGTDEVKFLTVLCVRNRNHLLRVFQEYQKISGRDIEDSIKREMSGCLEDVFLAIVKCLKNKPAFFAERLYKSMKGLGTTDSVVIRIMVARAEIDMLDIKAEFLKMYGKTLHSFIKGDTSGDYSKILLELCGGEKELNLSYETLRVLISSSQESNLSSITMAALGNRGTVTEASGFNPEEDAQKLYKAMKGAGTDEATIIEILGHRTIAQRQKIKESFKLSVGKELVDCLKSELSGNFEQVVVGLMMPAPVYDAYELRNAIKGAGTEEACLIDILASRTNAEVKEIIATYKKEYGKSLEDDVRADTSGMFQRVLVSLLTAGRDQSTKVDEAQAVQDAKDIYEAGEARWGTDEVKFLTVLCVRNRNHLLRGICSCQIITEILLTTSVFVLGSNSVGKLSYMTVFPNVFPVEYQKISGRDIEDSIKREMSGCLEDVFLAIVKCLKNKPAFFAERLYKSMKGLGTTDSVLIRIMVARAEIDMLDIKAEFLKMYGKTLHSFIKGDTSGDYSKILLELCGGEK
ncbi:annexin A4 [Carassius auratus]|uniref:Annexin n=1 Tax=Carassius auratus TaxID=7957 RepID=A0A6P6KUH6_CARAU|nr:annexin A6-like [Carassius auratus]